MEIKRILGPTFAAILAVGIGVGVYVSYGRKAETEAAREAAAAVVDVKGMIGSEKES